MKQLMMAACVAMGASVAMAEFSSGFARVDITPPYGCFIPGYYSVRHGKGVLDPLSASCVAFSDGTHTALVYSVDTICLGNDEVVTMQQAITAATGVGRDFVYLASTHIHTGATLREGGRKSGECKTADDRAKYDLYRRLVTARLADAGLEAMADLAPAALSVGRGRCPGVAFCRRYRMKDGSYRTNPGIGNPEIDAPAELQDDEVQLVRINRTGKKPIAIVNFQTHPDMLGGELYSADWPGAVRRTMENAFAGNLHCLFINGAEGDSNHHDAMHLHPNRVTAMTGKSYERSQHVGRSIAGVALTLWDNCEKVEAGAVRGVVTTVRVKARYATPEEIAEAHKIVALDKAGRRNEIKLPYEGMGLATVLAEAHRKVALEHGPDHFDMPISVIALGKGVAFGGFPGEAFMGYGVRVKKASPFAMTVVSCITNGDYVYMPTAKAFEQGGYEAGSSKYDPSVEERLVGGMLEELAKFFK